MKLFAYGELCKPPVLLEVLGRVPCAEPGVLHGYHRESNPETGFFRVVRRAHTRAAAEAVQQRRLQTGLHAAAGNYAAHGIAGQT